MHLRRWYLPRNNKNWRETRRLHDKPKKTRQNRQSVHQYADAVQITLRGRTHTLHKGPANAILLWLEYCTDDAVCSFLPMNSSRLIGDPGSITCQVLKNICACFSRVFVLCLVYAHRSGCVLRSPAFSTRGTPWVSIEPHSKGVHYCNILPIRWQCSLTVDAILMPKQETTHKFLHKSERKYDVHICVHVLHINPLLLRFLL